MAWKEIEIKSRGRKRGHLVLINVNEISVIEKREDDKETAIYTSDNNKWLVSASYGGTIRMLGIARD